MEKEEGMENGRERGKGKGGNSEGRREREGREGKGYGPSHVEY